VWKTISFSKCALSTSTFSFAILRLNFKIILIKYLQTFKNLLIRFEKEKKERVWQDADIKKEKKKKKKGSSKMLILKKKLKNIKLETLENKRNVDNW
jgi:hypothetical protein